jgi:hypothetical protein
MYRLMPVLYREDLLRYSSPTCTDLSFPCTMEVFRTGLQPREKLKNKIPGQIWTACVPSTWLVINMVSSVFTRYIESLKNYHCGKFRFIKQNHIVVKYRNPSSIYSGTSISRTSKETKNIRVIEKLSYRNTFFLLTFQLNLHQTYVLLQDKHSSICNINKTKNHILMYN